jgi:hypothetical protein
VYNITKNKTNWNNKINKNIENNKIINSLMEHNSEKNIKFKELEKGYILVNYNTFKQLNPIVFDEVSDFSNGFALVKIEGQGYNFINEKGELLWSEYKNFYFVDNFYDGFARVYKKDKGWNYINGQGELLYKGDIWFDFVENFSEGFAEVKIEDLGWNFINKQGELLYKGNIWFDSVYVLDNGIIEVDYKGDWYKLNTNGELIED